MKNKTIRWGILGLGHISHKFVAGLEVVENVQLNAVASSNAERAENYAQKYQIPFYYGSYEALAKSKEVDVVYIASYSNKHYEHAKLCLENGKHILCEKPATLYKDQTQALFDLAKEKNLFFMEALWTMFLPSMGFVEKVIKLNTYGYLNRVEATFGFDAYVKNAKRLLSPELGGGALYDIGIYPLLLALKFLGKPNEIISNVEFSESGVDTFSDYELIYPNAKAVLSCSFKEHLPNKAYLYFDNATIVFDEMWHTPTQVELLQNGEKEPVPIEWKGNGYNYEAQFVTDELLKGNTSQTFIPAEFSVELIDMIERILTN